MVQVNEITTKSVKDLANALNGKWGSEAKARCRYAIVGHVAFVECVGEITQYDIPVKPFNGWFAVASNANGFILYQAIIQ